MTTVLVVVGLAVYAAFFLWRVRVERGNVGRRSFAAMLEEWRREFAELERILGAAFVPALEGAAVRMAEYAKAFTAYTKAVTAAVDDLERSDP